MLAKARKLRNPYGISAKGRKLLRRVQKHILAEPLRLNMEVWMAKKGGAYDRSYMDEEYEYPPCKTVGCIAGWCCVLGSDKKVRTNHNVVADRLLGLDLDFDDSDKHPIFYWDNWPNKYYDMYVECDDAKGRAKAVSKFIDYICS